MQISKDVKRPENLTLSKNSINNNEITNINIIFTNFLS